MVDTVLVKDGRVTQRWWQGANDDLDASDYDGDLIDVPHGSVVSGMLYDGSTFTAPTPVVPPITEVSRIQFMVQTKMTDSVTSDPDKTLHDDIEAALAAMADGQAKVIAQETWAHAQTFHRDHALMATLASGLGLSDAVVDALFTAAAAVQA